ncbi:LacI family transcriptional regulator [Agrobacterium rhizogenes]|nr:LacI family transcriptional regulator [Agrobacterium sp. ICMP 7243]NTG18836.1 LacI family transcriptional regulator [Rhizobium rhizogenes]NTH36447.1 LacI family transcriptional regulator [Rhizobium rhizogenes]NTI00421.1 LacI family transcriptional regulator [Rhizobium rhizogenes]NTI07223.1 LacI family transcriptional regulator [Rhizobium rhizogenes]
MMAITSLLEIVLRKRSSNGTWKGPTVHEIAHLAGVGVATVDRVLNNRSGVRDKTRARILAVLEKLRNENSDRDVPLLIRLFCESGETFNAAMASAVTDVNRTLPGIKVEGAYVTTSELDPIAFARSIEQEGSDADGVVVVAREHPTVNRAIRKLRTAGIPVVCLTTDLPSSRRSAFVGNDQYAAGSVAALLIGNALPKERNSILIVMSVPFRCQQEREMGFRRVLRSDFPHLRIEERVISDERPENTCEQLLRYFEANGHPAAIYNVAGANRGVAKALEHIGKAQETVFVGHELSNHSRALLESGSMDYVISHDFAGELTSAARWIRDNLNGVSTEPPHSQILLHTRYNCGL